MRNSAKSRTPVPATVLVLVLVTWMAALGWEVRSDEPHVTKDDREFWSFSHVERPEIPTLRDASRVRTPIDAFLLAALEEKNLGFARDADVRTVVRRLFLDLIGLPPSPEEVASFLADESPDAYERLVDRLLASPHFGVRWGRHWLDVAGYVDTVGFDVDADLIITSEGKWRYRDYVVDAYNSDKPFDRFLTEQLAGDELVDWRNASKFTPEIREPLIATGYLRTAPDFTHEDVGNIPQNHFGVLHDTLEIVGSSLLGLTLNCARCHNHKFDPLPQEDYYRLMAVFTPAYNPNQWKIVFPYDKKIEDRSLPDVSPAERAAIDKWNTEIQHRVDTLTKEIEEIRRPARERLIEAKLQKIPEADRALVREALKIKVDKRSDRQKQLAAKFEKDLTADELAAALNPEQTHAVAARNDEIAQQNRMRQSYGRIQALYDVDKPPVTRQLVGGNYETPGTEIQPGILRVLSESDSSSNLANATSAPGTSGRRLALAKWLTAPDSRAASLAARVMTNRVWQHLFGTGIVPTPDNFGLGGEQPAHPELLEWLSAELMQNGWRIKSIVRLAVLSTAYRQSAVAEPGEAASRDPDNMLLGRMRMKRLESEVIRDSVLSVCGSIDSRLGGPPIMLEFRPDDGMILVSQKQLPYPAAQGRRSIYLLSRRAFPLSDLSVFDQPVVATNCVERSRSAVPLQSLSMLNGPLLWEQSTRLADRMRQIAGDDRGGQIGAAFEAVLSRPVSTEEKSWSERLLDKQASLHRESEPADGAVIAEQKALVHLCHTLLNTSEFLYVP